MCILMCRLSCPMPMKVDKAVKDSGDTARLHKKFERKLNALVNDVTPPHLADCMQDVVIEGARRLSEFFISKSYSALVKDALISEMQKRGNEILSEVDGAAETYFFAAQRLKKADSLEVREPCYRVASDINKKLDDMIKVRPLPRKLNLIMKDHIKDTSNFLSAMVTKPDDKIEAYVALLDEMEAEGDFNLVEGDIPKTYKEAADYLRQLTSNTDKINRPNSSMQAEIQSELKQLLDHVPPSGYSRSVMNSVIGETAGLLTSYIMLQGAKTAALNDLVQEMTEAGDGALLRHGPIRKSFKEGAELLRGKNIDQLVVSNPDPVVARKIQIKLGNLMQIDPPICCGCVESLMKDVIEDATMYLAVHLLEPQVIQVCKCYKNVFVQCELWCEEILRRVTRPCCTCSRHVSVQALKDLVPGEILIAASDGSRVFAPGVDITINPCPRMAKRKRDDSPAVPRPCPAASPTPGCQSRTPTTSYVMYSTSHQRFGYDSLQASAGSSDSLPITPMSFSPLQRSRSSSPIKSLLKDIHSGNVNFYQQQQEQMQMYEVENQKRLYSEPSVSYFSSTSNYNFGDSPRSESPVTTCLSPEYPSPMISNIHISDTSKITQAKSTYSSRTPIISTDQMADWHAMMVSLMWNMQAWRDWIQEIFEHALSYHNTPSTRDTWSSFQRRITTEALQWRQYSVFCHQLTTRLHIRYKDREFVSPTRPTAQTKTYIACQEEMLKIIEMFNKWTQWLTLVVKETNTLQQMSGAEDIPLHQTRWTHLKIKLEGYAKDWSKYNMFLKGSWEKKYSSVIEDYLPEWKKPGAVWVVSACGAVPSGAVAAGVFDGEVTWVARTTHKYLFRRY
ncbi:unnamed protein product [Spodoptera littoralis]|uniref:Uncharacterized protein n=1 Tax=Spodoptera littoralis TaxID=7109 RepID=A0A9P0N4H0_SPOLI|nr:unnamed protein product [Spodoptera littoralis]CAH1639549.1 unnamed protein product [Spodoptera littoralis]